MRVHCGMWLFFLLMVIPSVLMAAGEPSRQDGASPPTRPRPDFFHYQDSEPLRIVGDGDYLIENRIFSPVEGEYGIRVNLLAPGILEDGVSRVLPQHLRDEYVKHCGLKRVGTLSEVACLAAWLATENTYVTGETIVVDGGL